MNLIPGLYAVPQGHVALAERFGKFERLLSPGLNWVNPITTSVKDLSSWKCVANKYGYYMELAKQQLETEQRPCHTKDNVLVKASATIYWKIQDPKQAAYDIDVLPDSLKDACSKVLRAVIGCTLFDDIFSKRHEISCKVTTELVEKVKPWGVTLESVEVGELSFDSDLANALKKRRVAEAERDAKIAKAEEESHTSIKAAKTQIEKQQLELESQLKRKKVEAETEALCLKVKTESEAAANMEKARIATEVKKLESEAEVSAFSRMKNAEAESYTKLKEAEITYLKGLREQVGENGLIQLLSYRTAVEGFKSLGENQNNKIMLMPNNMKGFINAMIGADGVDVKPVIALPS